MKIFTLPTLHLHKGNFKPQPKQMAMDENIYITYFTCTQGQFQATTQAKWLWMKMLH
jgi:hypothetical protein